MYSELKLLSLKQSKISLNPKLPQHIRQHNNQNQPYYGQSGQSRINITRSWQLTQCPLPLKNKFHCVANMHTFLA